MALFATKRTAISARNLIYAAKSSPRGLFSSITRRIVLFTSAKANDNVFFESNILLTQFAFYQRHIPTISNVEMSIKNLFTWKYLGNTHKASLG